MVAGADAVSRNVRNRALQADAKHLHPSTAWICTTMNCTPLRTSITKLFSIKLFYWHRVITQFIWHCSLSLFPY